jgi:uncharacterized protein (TIGR00255 family)
MTGFGRAESAEFAVEAQSVNHRFLEVRARLPRRWSELEQRIQQAVQQRFARGHFDVTLEDRSQEGSRSLRVDLDLARQYVMALRTLQRELSLSGEVSLEMLAGQRDLVAVEEAEQDLEAIWTSLEPVLIRALTALAAMREREGRALTAVLDRHLLDVQGGLGRIRDRAPEAVRAQRDRLRERVRELLDGRLPDAERLEQEVALLAERGDIAEECDRLASHLTQFREALGDVGPQGRRLDFLLQEMNREVNTIGSKAGDAGIAQDVVGLKTAVERLREQVQNVE